MIGIILKLNGQALFREEGGGGIFWWERKRLQWMCRLIGAELSIAALSRCLDKKKSRVKSGSMFKIIKSQVGVLCEVSTKRTNLHLQGVLHPRVALHSKHCQGSLWAGPCLFRPLWRGKDFQISDHPHRSHRRTAGGWLSTGRNLGGTRHSLFTHPLCAEYQRHILLFQL